LNRVVLEAELRPPIVEFVDYTGTDIEIDSSTAFNRVVPRVNSAGAANRMRPNIPINSNGAAISSVVIGDNEIRESISRRAPGTSKVASGASGTEQDCDHYY
jgi:hypothetical protein